MEIENKSLRFLTRTLAAFCAAFVWTQKQWCHRLARTPAQTSTGGTFVHHVRSRCDRRGSKLATEQKVTGLTYSRIIPSRGSIVPMIILNFVFTATGGTKLLTTDPLTGLPLIPATDSRLHLGNEPTQLPESRVCKSKMQVDFYSVFDSKLNATLTWYDAHLPGFKKTHAYAANRSQDTYYKADGTMIVSVSGSPGKEGENTDTYSVLYGRLQPGLSEKTIVSLNQQNVVCP